MHEENSPEDYSDAKHKEAMQNFRTYLAHKNKNYEPIIVDSEILECPTNSTQKGIIMQIITRIFLKLYIKDHHMYTIKITYIRDFLFKDATRYIFVGFQRDSSTTLYLGKW